MAPLPWTSKQPEFLHASKSVQTTTPQTLVTGTTIFRVTGGPIHVTQLISYCVTSCDATAATLSWSADGDVGAATVFQAASASLASFAAGGVIVSALTSLAGVPVITGTAGVFTAGAAPGIVIPAGVITTTIASGPTTGTFLHFLRYTPLSPSSNVLVA